MRIAVVSDVHGNRTAFEAVLADLRRTAPDRVFHGGDLADGGASPAEVVDRIRDLGWPGVCGNADELLWAPEALTAFADQSPGVRPLLPVIREMAEVTREALGAARIAWLRDLPRVITADTMALVHAGPDDLWRAPGPAADDAGLAAVYGPLDRPVAVYGHVHVPFVRRPPGLTVANAGSVGLPYDGDPRASYLLLDDLEPTIRRVEYDIRKEREVLAGSYLPHAGWVAKMIEGGRFQMP